MAINSPTAISPRARLIQRLLWGTLINAILAFGCSMVMFGWMSWFTTPPSSGVSFIYSTTLLSLTAKERKMYTLHQSSGVGASNGREPTSTSTSTPLRLPHTLRKPAIVFAFLIALLWLLVLGFLISMHAIVHWGDFGYPDDKPPPKIGASITETILVAGQVGMMVTLFVMCVKERKGRINAEGTWKWYELGEYKVDV